jgi:hypothetical protein
MREPFTLAPGHISDDVVESLEFLLEQARRGDVFGIAYVVQLKRRKFIMDTAGESQRNPLYTVSLLHLLMAQLTDRVRGRD